MAACKPCNLKNLWYNVAMSALLEKAISVIRHWPTERQDEAAQMILSMGEDGRVYMLSVEERADVEEGLREIERGEIASDAEVQAVYRKHGL